MMTVGNTKRLVLGGILFLAGVLLGGVSVRYYQKSVREQVTRALNNIRKTTVIPTQERYLSEIVGLVGIDEAQELLYRSGLPFTGETHLLAHLFGKQIFRVYGTGGLPHCRDYFLAACYHAFLIEVLSHYGESAVPDVLTACRAAGPSVTIQCSHAMGHGFLVWKDYDLPTALTLCDVMVGNNPDVPAFNCYDGVFMENVYGVHGGTPSPKRWIRKGESYYPCTDSRIAPKYLGACWSNQATVMYQDSGGDYATVAKLCDGVSEEQYRIYCYHNFARQIHPEAAGNLNRVLELCGKATGERWRIFCIRTVAAAAYSIGDRNFPFSLCDTLSERDAGDCRQGLY